MSVYTSIETDELTGFLSNYAVGRLRDYQGISDGIENTNYFVNTINGDDRCFVLTLWDGGTLSGIIDFYDACDDILLYDVAVLVNDWCNTRDAVLDKDKVVALLQAYNSYRPFQDNEQRYWSTMLRAGALRFWLSRLHDKHFPRPGELVHMKNPDVFRAILKDRIANSDVYREYWI